MATQLSVCDCKMTSDYVLILDNSNALMFLVWVYSTTATSEKSHLQLICFVVVFCAQIMSFIMSDSVLRQIGALESKGTLGTLWELHFKCTF